MQKRSCSCALPTKHPQGSIRPWDNSGLPGLQGGHLIHPPDCTPPKCQGRDAPHLSAIPSHCCTEKGRKGTSPLHIWGVRGRGGVGVLLQDGKKRDKLDDKKIKLKAGVPRQVSLSPCLKLFVS